MLLPSTAVPLTVLVPVIVGVAYVVVGWHLPVWQGFAAVCLGGLALTLLGYEGLVRRTNPTRFLFGMKPRRPATVRPPVADAQPAPTSRSYR